MRYLVLILPLLIIDPRFGRAAPAAVALSGRLDADGMVGFAGGRQLGSESSYLLQWGGTLDTAAAGWWPGGRIDFSIEGVHPGGTPGAGTGALQVPNNEWAPGFLRVYQLTYRQDFGVASLRAGIMDINQYFEASDQADLLHNASYGLAPVFTANFNDPSFPNPGLGAMGDVHLGANWTGRIGIWQGNPPQLAGALRQGALSIGELERDWGPSRGDSPVTDVKVGAWRYRQSNPALGHDTSGAYLVGETRWTHAQQQWGAFVLAGTAPAQVNLVTRFVAAGVLVNGLFSARPQDAFSLGMTRVGLRAPHAETALEAVYSWQITRAFALQPDVQRFWHTGGFSKNAWVAGLRAHLTF